MMARSSASLLWLVCALSTFAAPQTPELALRRIHPANDSARAIVRVLSAERSPHPIPRFITGKFAEHLGHNIYNGMDAQILRNPTFAEYPFWNGQMTPDGVTKFHVDDAQIDEELRRQAARFGYPDGELDAVVQARANSLACFWIRQGQAGEVQVSPDTGPYGGRAQRVRVNAPDQGIAQWTWLPLHRQRRYEVEVMARSAEPVVLKVALWGPGGDQPCTSAVLQPLTGPWSKAKGTLTVPAELPAEVAYKLTITAAGPGEFVLRHALLRPVDHIAGADPEVVRFLRESKLPLLRWPGGNFVSTYHWERGIGPLEQRITEPNLAWGAIEPHTFGTAEFIAFCRAVGCEPMICVNAGSGTPEEAARWIEYCNGPVSSPMGRLRAAHGYSEPFGVRHWEVGNELWGKWQMRWTTAHGYVDRFQQFATAMRAADPTVQIYSCGAPAMWGKDWNDTLLTGVGPSLGIMTDHPLIGGNVPPSTEPVDIYRDFMAVPEVLQQKWEALRDSMRRSGISLPQLAVTELQVFAHVGRATDPAAPVRLTRETLPGQGSITEAIYDILVYHAALRLTPFVGMITHSATVNHGGGLRKERERVWANPCHYAQAAFAAFAGATPVAVELQVPMEKAPMVLPDLRQASSEVTFSAVDAFAATTGAGDLLLSLVHRGSSGPIDLEIQFPGFTAAASAQVRILTAKAPWQGNSREHPQAIVPHDTEVPVREGFLRLTLQPYTVGRITVRP